MKKTYITPNVKAYKLHTTSILAGSDGVNYGGGDGNTGGTVEAGSKHSSIWDNE